MAAVRAEMPGIAVTSASIGFCHGVFCSLLEGSGLMSEPWLKTQWGVGEIEKALAASAFSRFENLKRGQGRRASQKSP